MPPVVGTSLLTELNPSLRIRAGGKFGLGLIFMKALQFRFWMPSLHEFYTSSCMESVHLLNVNGSIIFITFFFFCKAVLLFPHLILLFSLCTRNLNQERKHELPGPLSMSRRPRELARTCLLGPNLCVCNVSAPWRGVSCAPAVVWEMEDGLTLIEKGSSSLPRTSFGQPGILLFWRGG